jgi:hypothetical protein
VPADSRDNTRVAIKTALNQQYQPEVARQLVKEAEMIARVESHNPQSICRLYHQPRATDGGIRMADGRQQPVVVGASQPFSALCDYGSSL